MNMNLKNTPRTCGIHLLKPQPPQTKSTTKSLQLGDAKPSKLCTPSAKPLSNGRLLHPFFLATENFF